MVVIEEVTEGEAPKVISPPAALNPGQKDEDQKLAGQQAPFALTMAFYGVVNLLLNFIFGVYRVFTPGSGVHMTGMLPSLLQGLSVFVGSLICATLAMTAKPLRVVVGRLSATCMLVALSMYYILQIWEGLSWEKSMLSLTLYSMKFATTCAALAATQWLKPKKRSDKSD
eukprot:TRINITY_DN31479_c0_g1_i1.p1 TRINITY_DN31479_c0_g1~~TRINITY_DN31479_c0_g1_i1.p1  ORF type:complete len:170 (-),score=26.51 TRINITY_DN31479_c0_g1_i1:138-647(-)